MRQEHSQRDTPTRLPINRFASIVVVSFQDLKVINREFRKVIGDRCGVVDSYLALFDELQTRDLTRCGWAGIRCCSDSGRLTHRSDELRHGEEVKDWGLY
jgi:hypothetical protein